MNMICRLETTRERLFPRRGARFRSKSEWLEKMIANSLQLFLEPTLSNELIPDMVFLSFISFVRSKLFRSMHRSSSPACVSSNSPSEWLQYYQFYRLQSNFHYFLKGNREGRLEMANCWRRNCLNRYCKHISLHKYFIKKPLNLLNSWALIKESNGFVFRRHGARGVRQFIANGFRASFR